MILILRDKVMNYDDFKMMETNVKRKLAPWPEAMFNSWYNKRSGQGHFKISQKHIEILELEFYILGD